MAWEENPRICLHMQLIAILSRTEVTMIKTYHSIFRMNKKNTPLKESFSDFICNFAVSIDEFSCLFCSTKTGEFSEMK